MSVVEPSAIGGFQLERRMLDIEVARQTAAQLIGHRRWIGVFVEHEERALAPHAEPRRIHRVGDAQADDTVVYARPDQPQWGYRPWVSFDGRWLVVTIWVIAFFRDTSNVRSFSKNAFRV